MKLAAATSGLDSVHLATMTTAGLIQARSTTTSLSTPRTPRTASPSTTLIRSIAWSTNGALKLATTQLDLSARSLLFEKLIMLPQKACGSKCVYFAPTLKRILLALQSSFASLFYKQSFHSILTNH
ncbi:hypothetical protein L596_029683 [Steinernema carpocapsae]|nr:hypothetical protein L596_029683 [Steinernema carpocapsae]